MLNSFFYTISHVQVGIIQISIYKFVFIYDPQTQQKNLEFQKKDFPLEPRYAGMCMFSTKTFETRAIQFESRACSFLFLYQNHQDTIQDLRLIRIHFHAI
jgi:hypothetical protein